MCSLHCNATAHKGLEKIRKAGGYTNIESHLANLADDDTIEEEKGLGQLWNSVSAWAGHGELCKVRKYRSSRHRFYFLGNHKDCNYHLRFVIPFKKDETDQAKAPWFREKVLKAMTDDKVYRTLQTSHPTDAEDGEG